MPIRKTCSVLYKSPEIYFLEIQLRFKTKMTKRQCINDPKTLVPSRKKGTDEPKDGTVLKKKKQSSTDPLALSVYLVSYKVV